MIILAHTAAETADRLGYVLAVNLVIWAGIVLYLVRLERRLRRWERERGS